MVKLYKVVSVLATVATMGMPGGAPPAKASRGPLNINLLIDALGKIEHRGLKTSVRVFDRKPVVTFKDPLKP